MLVASISEFRKQMKRYSHEVKRDHVPLIVTCTDDFVVISLDDYNALTETDYLNSSPANRRHLEESMAQLRAGKVVTKTLEELRRYE